MFRDIRKIIISLFMLQCYQRFFYDSGREVFRKSLKKQFSYQFICKFLKTISQIICHRLGCKLSKALDLKTLESIKSEIFQKKFHIFKVLTRMFSLAGRKFLIRQFLRYLTEFFSKLFKSKSIPSLKS